MHIEIGEILSVNRTMEEWLSFFEDLTVNELLDLYDAVISFALKGSVRSMPLTLLVSLARKLLEFGHFYYGLTDAQREWAISNATTVYEGVLASFSEGQAIRVTLETGWAALIDRCNRFGYRSGAIYEALAPHKMFR